jgi:hypothetical protein
MPFQKWLREKNVVSKLRRRSTIINDNLPEESNTNNEKPSGEDILMIYLSNGSAIKTVVTILQSINENETKVSYLIIENIFILYLDLHI